MSDAFDPGCIFCKIAREDFGTEFIAESEHCVAFRDIDPKAPTHVLIVPRRHVASLHADGLEAALLSECLMLAREVAEREGVGESGYRVLTNIGSDGGQTVFHMHFHVLGGHKLTAGLG